MSVTQLDHLNLSVRDFDETAEWYRRVFGFEVVEENSDAKGVRWGVLKAGEAMLCIYQHPDAEMVQGSDVIAKGMHAVKHFGLRIHDRKQWEATLEREKLELHYDSPVAWPHSTAWYVADPTGWEIEVVLWDGDEIAFG